jgi:cytochrome c
MRYLFILLTFIIADSCDHPEEKTIQKAPDEHRFKKTILSNAIKDPIDLAISPDGKIYVTERKGWLKVYDPETRKISVAAYLKCDSGSWDGGLKGMVFDPDYEKNRWAYINYAPFPNNGFQRISRFILTGKGLDTTSEKILLEFPAEAHRHLGGDMAFDSKGNLYISSGDNTKPGNAYSPHDERPGQLVGDAQRSSGNTNDLRGKIIRIHPEAYGKHTIPEGNLFKPEELLTRSEIFVMGCRNAFKIHVDQVNDVLYWGDVGPDAGADGPFGPQGYDEINRTNKAGNFGWPYFIGDNKAYHNVDPNTNTSRFIQDQAKPRNESPNNTGKKILPPAQKAWIWYPYVPSKEFPVLGVAGRTAMAGPVYHYRFSNKNQSKFPEWFDKKLFIFEWMRNWIMTVEMEPDGKIKEIIPLMPSTFFNHPMAIEFGSDGCLYVLEYGSNWIDNNDSRLVKVEYIWGNRAPVAEISANKTYGQVPLTVKFSSKGSLDYDENTMLRYEWNFTSHKVESAEANPTFTFTQPGTYMVRVNVFDQYGKSDYKEVKINAGNSLPVVQIKGIEPNQFYWPGMELNYAVSINDTEDGSTANGKIKSNDVKVSLSFDPDGMAGVDKNVSDTMTVGRKLMNGSDCKSCHSIDQKSTGPSFNQIAARYVNDQSSVEKLAAKIIVGGSGIWGEAHMSAHPQLSTKNAQIIVRYILSLASNPTQRLLPLSGSIKTNSASKSGIYKLTAAYTDKGGPGIGSLEGTQTTLLKSPILFAKNFSIVNEQIQVDDLILLPFGTAYLSFKNINFKGAKSVVIDYSVETYPQDSYVELHIDKPDGELIASGRIPEITNGKLTLSLKPITGSHELFITYKMNPKLQISLGITRLEFIR